MNFSWVFMTGPVRMADLMKPILVEEIRYSDGEVKKFVPEKIRRVKFFDKEKGRSFSFLSNNFILPALIIADLYKCRWQVELFFKWIKQHLRIKSFYGTSENAVKTQIWIAVSVYVLVAIVKKKLKLDDLSLYTILQILSVTLFEKMPLYQMLTVSKYINITKPMDNQLKLFVY